jgi:hypothetical protein
VFDKVMNVNPDENLDDKGEEDDDDEEDDDRLNGVSSMSKTLGLFFHI